MGPLVMMLMLPLRAEYVGLTARGSLVTNNLIITSNPSSEADNGSNLPSLRFGLEPLCSVIEGDLAGTSLSIKTGKGQSLASFKVEDDKTLLELGNLKVNGHLDISDGSFIINGKNQWRLAVHEVFTLNMAPEGWDVSNPEIVTDCAGVIMLGGYKKFSQGEISKIYTNLPPHEYIRVVANYHFLDNWTGDTGFLRINAGKDGSLVHVWTDSHTAAAKGINVCGNPNVPESKFSVPIDITIPHSSSKIKLGFGSTMKTNIPDEASWGISLVELYIK
ncbi:hypothetical protein GNI_026140 [Gregarina niphandrodes]|uniref:Uncharacterized protein n=1 Tax=Gregarina niphandrodes TaxID=110365 RepID=A0A023BBM2_GRENI|nr:hypothetical protein GNI_026140 [Gregarina niphandrodes]EZG79492.1 hypothetical protein GNI_026140 [Gregarina niphandrodes]|eukprot:XP_011134428.1 hypothetical protein GNI_026140 [Gregarina niphandrodes]